MSVQFHDGTIKIYESYSMGYPWNHLSLIGNVPSKLKFWNTKETMTQLLEKIDPAKMKAMESDFKGLLASQDVSFWVVKGMHQSATGFVLTPHITLGYIGFLWHIDFLDDHKYGLSVFNVTKGDQQTNQDADGFSIVKKKKSYY